MTTTTVHAPGNPSHFMHVKPVKRRIRVIQGGAVLADTSDAIRIMETGREPYDPVLYIPLGDVCGLEAVEGKSTHCPLKGDASYLSHAGGVIGWTYDRPLPDASMLKERVAFYPDRVTFEEIGAEA